MQGYVEANANDETGTALKSETGWDEYEDTPQGADEFGFCALPAGGRYSDGSFNYLGERAFFCSSTEYSVDYAYRRGLIYVSEDFGESWYDKAFAYSVRLLRD